MTHDSPAPRESGAFTDADEDAGLVCFSCLKPCDDVWAEDVKGFIPGAVYCRFCAAHQRAAAYAVNQETGERTGLRLYRVTVLFTDNETRYRMALLLYARDEGDAATWATTEGEENGTDVAVEDATHAADFGWIATTYGSIDGLYATRDEAIEHHVNEPVVFHQEIAPDRDAYVQYVDGSDERKYTVVIASISEAIKSGLIDPGVLAR